MSHLRRLIVFLTIFAFILAASHFYMFERLSYYLQMTESQRLFTALLLGGFACLTLIALPVSRLLPRKAAVILAWISYPWMGIALLMFITLLITDMVWLLSQMIPANHLPEPRVLLQHYLGVVALSVTGLLGGLALWKGLGSVTVKPLTIALNRLPQSFDGLRIVQLTDLHVGPLINGRWLRRVVDKVNALKPDVIVITGDLVDGSVEELRRHVAPLADLRAQHGTYFITGNHEYYSGVDAWCNHIASLGVRVLRNERVSITSGSADESLDLAGVDDWASRHFPGEGPDLAKALAGRDTDKALILLAHQPAAAHEAAAHGVDLQLSGHTHGGQIWPFTYLVYLQQPYTTGLYRHNGTQTQVYVSPGTGFWGPPMRLGTTAEITLITLRSVA
ncbi:MAG: putative integral rane protein [Herbaspirillum sp.]|nr:putative integral rane protein [Herbaspirillum sp.]